MRISILIIGVLCLVPMASPGQAAGIPGESKIQEWSQEYRAGHADTVLQQVTQDLLSRSPDPFAVQVWCAVQYSLGHLTKSGAAITNPALAKALGRMPELYYLYQQNQYPQMLKAAADLRPGQIEDPWESEMLGFAALQVGDTQRAMEYAVAGARHHSDFFLLAWLTFDIAQADEQERKELTQVVADGSDLAKTPFGRFERTMLQKRPLTEEWRIEAVQAFLKDVPDDSQALRFEALHLTEEKRYEEASTIFRQAYDLYPFHFDGSDWEEALLRLGQSEQARQVAAWSAQIDSNDPANAAAETEVYYARALDSVGKPLEAEAEIKKALAKNGANAALLNESAVLASDDGRFADAVEAARKAATEEPQNLQYAGSLLKALKQTNPEQAAAEYQKAFNRLPFKDEDFFHLGSSIYEKLKQPHKWVANAQAEAAAFPRSGWTLGQLSLALESEGDNEEALDALNRSFDYWAPPAWWLGPYQRLVAKTEGSVAVPGRLSALIARFPFALSDQKAPKTLPAAQLTRSSIHSQKLSLVMQSPHQRRLVSFTLSRDNALLASADETGVLKLWDRASGLLLRTIQAHSLAINQVVFADQDKLVITGGDDDALRAWDVRTGDLAWGLSGWGIGRRVSALASNGEFVVAAISDSIHRTFHLLLINAADGKVLRTIDWYVGQGQKTGIGLVKNVWISRDGKLAATLNSTEGLQIWDLATTRLLASLPEAHRIAAVSDDFSRIAYVVSTYEGADEKVIVTQGPRFTDTVESFDLGEIATAAAQGVHPQARKNQSPSSGNENGPMDTGDSKEPFPAAWDLSGLSFNAGSTLLVTMTDYDARDFYIWNTQRKAPVFSVGLKNTDIPEFATSNDLRYFLIARRYGSNYTMEVYDRTQSDPRPQVAFDIVRSSTTNTVAFAPGGDYIAISRGNFSGSTALWDLALGKVTTRLPDATPSIAISPDGKLIADCNGIEGGHGQLWRIATGSVERNFSDQCGSIPSPVVFTRDGKAIVWQAGTFVYLRSLDGESVAHWNVGDVANSIAVTPNGQYIYVAAGKSIKKISPSSDEVSDFYSGSGNAASIRSLAIDDTGKYLVAAFGGAILHQTSEPRPEFGIKIWDLATGNEVRNGNEVPGVARPGVSALAFRPATTIVAAGEDDHKVVLWDARTGERQAELSTGNGTVSSVAFSANGAFLIAASDDGSAVIWDARSLKELTSLFTLGGGNWAVVDPEGRFDASAGGMQSMHYVVGLEPIDLHQLEQRYFAPGLLHKILDKEYLAPVSAFDHVDLYPKVQPIGSVDAAGRLQVKLINRGGGIGKVQVFVNRKQLLADARGPRPDPNAKEETLTLDLRGAAVVPGRPNDVRIVVSNAEGYIHSRGVIVRWTPPGVSANYKPDLYAIVAGISKYSDPNLKLRFSSHDADTMARALQLAGDRLFGCAHVHISLLSSEPPSQPFTCSVGASPQTDNVTWTTPTEAHLKQAILEARKARPEDVLVIYLAGHGVAIKDTYVYPTADATTIDPATLASDRTLLTHTAITSGELVDWLNKIPALHQVMILDTCAAGAAAAKLSEKRGVPGDQIRALDQLKDDTGFHVLMGSAANASSYEASRFGEGLLTYSLLMGMRGAALKNDSGVDVSALFQYAMVHVPELARDINAVQQPEVFEPLKAQSFDIGELLPQDRRLIPLAKPEAVILRPVLLNSEDLTDNLNLMAAVREALRDATEPTTAARGNSFPRPQAMYVDADQMPDALRPTGTYTVTGKQVVVHLVLTQDKVQTRVEVEGTTTDTAGLVAKIVKAILSAAHP